MHFYKIKHNLRKIAQNNTTSFSQLSPLTVQLTEEKRWDHPLLQGFHFCCWYFCAMEQGWRGETLKARSLWHVGIVVRSAERPAHLHPTSHSSRASRQAPSLCVFRSFASRLGYRAWTSWLMDTKQRSPWWWRELGKLGSIPAFNTHTHTRAPQLFLSISSCLTVSVSVCSQSA